MGPSAIGRPLGRPLGPLAAAVLAELLRRTGAEAAGLAGCPEGSFKSGSIVWQAGGNEGFAHFLLEPEEVNGRVEIPAGVWGLTLVAEAGVRVGLQLLDPSSNTMVVDRDGFISEKSSGGEYKHMVIKWSAEVGSPSRENCTIQDTTTIPLVLRFRNYEKGRAFVTLRYKFSGVEAATSPPAGCSAYDEVATCQALAGWSKWAKGQYAEGPEAAWTALAAPYAFAPLGGTVATLPYFLWDSVWRSRSPGSQVDPHAVFYRLDTNRDSHVSKEEFVAGYQFADGAACEAQGADLWWTNWVLWASVGLGIWLVGVAAVLLLFKGASKREAPYARLGRGGAALPLTQGSVIKVPDGPHRATYERILGDDTLRRAIEAHPAALRFHQARVLAYGERLEDGFVASFARELLLVDGRRDPPLRRFLDFAQGSLAREPGEAGRAADLCTVAKAVAAALGGASAPESAEREGLASRFDRRLESLHQEGAELLQLGSLLGQGAGARRELGAGLQRHRAVLLKYTCDALQLCDTALLWDARRDTVVAAAWLGDRAVVVDVTQEPGELSRGDDLHRLVEETGGRAPTPFSLPEVQKAEARTPPAGHRVQLAVSPLFGVLGMTAYHSSVVVDGTEYYFADGGIGTSSGLESHENPAKPDKEVQTLEMGFSPHTGPELKEALREYFAAGTYDLLTKNCNAFSDCALHYLLRKRLDARFCMLEGLGASNVDLFQHASGGQYKPNPDAANFDLERTLAGVDVDLGLAPPAAVLTDDAGAEGATLRILVRGARHLARAGSYCTCGVADKPGSELRTAVSRDAPDPVWNLDAELPELGELRLDVWSEGDEHLGSAGLSRRQLGAGFDGELPLTDGEGRATGGVISFRVAVTDPV